jgi:hypothetical protein
MVGYDRVQEIGGLRIFGLKNISLTNSNSIFKGNKEDVVTHENKIYSIAKQFGYEFLHYNN